ncbi:MAG: helix-turn-helix transcriptional regulator [Oscillospiraceae bacterium]|nr:helix-turn-helix transcriptional regulator [Oscillospiraceae bacterium]
MRFIICLLMRNLSYDKTVDTVEETHMALDYKEIGKRITRRRNQLGLKQSEVEELAEISYGYLTNIERAVSIPSIEVVMRLAIALETTPDEFLVGTSRREGEEWRDVAELLRTMDGRQLDLARSFLTWLLEQKI